MPGTNNGRTGPHLSLVAQEKDVGFYLREVESHGGPVLILGTGTGRIAWELALHGHQVVGVDPSEVMISSAEERRSREAPDAADRARFLCADLRSLRLAERFPLVVAPQNALSLMGTRDDLDGLFATVRHHLSDGGTFAFDVLNPHREPPPPDAPQDAWHPKEGVEPPRPVFAPHLRERVRSRAAPEHEQSGIRRLRLRQFTVADLDEALADGLFVPTERYGAFDRRPFGAGDPLQVVVAVRAPDEDDA